MKLLEMNAAQLCEALVKVCVPLSNLCSDEEVYEMVDSFKARVKESKLPVVASGELLGKLIPLLLKKHLADTMQILALVEGRPLKEVMAMNGAELMMDVASAWKKELMPFFTQCACGVGTASSSR